MEKIDSKTIAENSVEENVVEVPTNEEIVESEDVDPNDVKAIELALSIGQISLEFHDGICPADCNYPKTYYTVNGKERLVLIFAENFRRKYLELHPNRNPLVLAVPNEYEIQKFVSTTIRSSVILFHELIDCWQGPGQFVADFIKYEPLDDQIAMVSTYMCKIIPNRKDLTLLGSPSLWTSNFIFFISVMHE